MPPKKYIQAPDLFADEIIWTPRHQMVGKPLSSKVLKDLEMCWLDLGIDPDQYSHTHKPVYLEGPLAPRPNISKETISLLMTISACEVYQRGFNVPFAGEMRDLGMSSRNPNYLINTKADFYIRRGGLLDFMQHFGESRPPREAIGLQCFMTELGRETLKYLYHEALSLIGASRDLTRTWAHSVLDTTLTMG